MTLLTPLHDDIAPRRSREYPDRPLVGVAGPLLEGDRVLSNRRGRPPFQGARSLPGRALCVREPGLDEIVRELIERTLLHAHLAPDTTVQP